MIGVQDVEQKTNKRIKIILQANSNIIATGVIVKAKLKIKILSPLLLTFV